MLFLLPLTIVGKFRAVSAGGRTRFSTLGAWRLQRTGYRGRVAIEAPEIQYATPPPKTAILRGGEGRASFPCISPRRLASSRDLIGLSLARSQPFRTTIGRRLAPSLLSRIMIGRRLATSPLNISIQFRIKSRLRLALSRIIPIRDWSDFSIFRDHCTP